MAIKLQKPEIAEQLKEATNAEQIQSVVDQTLLKSKKALKKSGT